MLRGGQNSLRPATIRGTPMMSSGASWLPSSETQGRPTAAANCSTMEDFPMPGAPQMNTGRTVATFSSTSISCFWLTEIAKFKFVVPPNIVLFDLRFYHNTT